MTALPVCNFYTPGSGCELNRNFPAECRLGCRAYSHEPRNRAIRQEWHETVYPDKPALELPNEYL